MVRNLKKKKKKNLKSFIIGLIVILILSIIGYRSYVYFSETNKIKNIKINITDELNVEKISNSCNVSDGFISLYIPSEFTKNKNDKSSLYDLNYTEDGRKDASISFKEINNLKEVIKDNKDSTKDLELLEKNNINNGYDLVKKYYDMKKKGINIFTSPKNVKISRIAVEYINSIKTSNDIFLLEGDIKGLLFKSKNLYQAIIYNEDVVAFVEFSNDKKEYFNDDNIIEFISMIEFI